MSPTLSLNPSLFIIITLLFLLNACGRNTTESFSVMEQQTAEQQKSEPPAKKIILGDWDDDRCVDFTDLGILLNNYHQPVSSKYASGDMDGNKYVDFTDLGMLLEIYGQCF